MLSEEIIKDAEAQPQPLGYNFQYKIKNGLVTLSNQEEALQEPRTAYWFAYYISGADIERCQDIVCSSDKTIWPYLFALKIPGANIEKCQRATYKPPYYWASVFVKEIKGANLDEYREACKESKYVF